MPFAEVVVLLNWYRTSSYVEHQNKQGSNQRPRIRRSPTSCLVDFHVCLRRCQSLYAIPSSLARDVIWCSNRKIGETDKTNCTPEFAFGAPQFEFKRGCFWPILGEKLAILHDVKRCIWAVWSDYYSDAIERLRRLQFPVLRLNILSYCSYGPVSGCYLEHNSC